MSGSKVEGSYQSNDMHAQASITPTISFHEKMHTMSLPIEFTLVQQLLLSLSYTA